MSEELEKQKDRSRSGQRLQEQCFLAANILNLRVKSNRQNFYTVDGNSLVARNNLISIKNVAGFLDLPTHMLSSLVPSFRLLKETDSGSMEYRFDDHHKDVSKLTMDRFGRGSNAGFKSFSFDFTGGTPSTSEALVESSLRLHFASLQDLSAADSNGNSFLDLLSQPSRFTEKDKCSKTGGTFNSRYYRIKVEVGFEKPIGEFWSKNPKLADQVELVRRVFFLTLVDHEIDFREDGSIELNLNYQAYVDKLLVDMDVFDLAIPKANREKLDKLKAKACANTKKPKPSTNPGSPAEPASEEDESKAEEKKKEELEETNEEILDEKSLAYSAFFSELFKKDKVYKIELSEDELGSGNLDRKNKKGKVDPTAAKDVKEVVKDAAEARDSFGSSLGITDTKKENIADEKEKLVTDRNKWSVRDDKYYVHYFFLGDLLDVAFSVASMSQHKNLKFLLGTFPYRDTSGKIIHVPLADIPISLNLFASWFIDHVITKGEKDTYPLKSFVADVFSNLVRPALTPKCYDKKKKEKDPSGDKAVITPRLSIETLVAPPASSSKCQVTGDSLEARGGKSINGSSISVNYKSNSATKGDIMYYYVYATSRIMSMQPPKDASISTFERDSKFGIYHLTSGKESGLVKNISFKRTDQAGMREARIEQSGVSGKGRIRDKYDVDIQMFGSPLFKPGMTVWVDPITNSSHADRQIAKEIGLGGYFKVVKVQNYLESGNFSTDLECVWESSGGDS